MAETTDISHDPEWARWLGSMEGVPDWPEPAESPAEQAGRNALQNRFHQVFGWLGALCPGVALALILASAGLRGANWLGTTVLGFVHSPISPIMVALLLGLAIRRHDQPSCRFLLGRTPVHLKYVLRLGIMLLGLRLSLVAVGEIGLVGLPIILGCIASALVLVTWINRALGLPKAAGNFGSPSARASAA